MTSKFPSRDLRAELLVTLKQDGDGTAPELAQRIGCGCSSYQRMVLRVLEEEGLIHVDGIRNKFRVFRIGPDPVGEGMKKCTRCREVKPADADHFPRQKGGLHGWCLVCRRAYSAEHNRKARISESLRDTQDIDANMADVSQRYMVKEVSPGHRQYRLAGGYKTIHEPRQAVPMAGYQSALARIA